MKIAIIGYGLQGQSVYEYYKGPDNEITICDSTIIKDLPTDVDTQFGPAYLSRLDRFDVIFRGPAVHPQDIVVANSPQILTKITTNTNEFLKNCPTKNIIGVTGTKGKGTTSTLITKILEDIGYKVHLGGNIGTPPLDLLKTDIREKDWVVLELANFQLIDLALSPKIAVCLMVVPEHLDWHSDVNEYYQAKTELFRHQTKDGVAVYYARNENSKRIASTSPGKLIPFYEAPGALVAGSHITIDGLPIIRLNEIKLVGKHNWQNICAAITTVWQIDPNPESAARVLRDFSGLPFRIELIREFEDVKYYDDSFSANPASAVAAIEAVKRPKIIIIGGRDRGIELTDLANVIAAHSEDIRKVLIIGEAKERIKNELDAIKFSNYEIMEEGSDMRAIVFRAKELAKEGDSVVLSPGFPSFDMFKNFEDRGLQFNEAVRKL